MGLLCVSWFLGTESYPKVCSSEDVSNVRSFFADICETGPFLGSRRVLRLGWFEGVRFVRFDGEGVV